MAAVASVIRNRLAAGGYGRTPYGIVHAPGQFEAWHPPGGTGPALTASPTDASYKQAAALAQGVFSGVVQDQTQGATHFYAPVAQADLNRPAPTWSGTPPTASIGGHQFYAPSGPVTSEQVAGLKDWTPPGPDTVAPGAWVASLGPSSSPTSQAPPPVEVAASAS